ncbi:MAG: polyprenyl synthetase family protein [Ardenticatenaceae bacterium]|nr:polyprenyl synthetase family protein [Ardenticatenaceae bacterium]
MDIFQAIERYLIQLPVISEWPELQMIWKKAARSEPSMWQLPINCCEAVGGRFEQALPLAAAVAALHTSIILIDDMLDEDPRGEHHVWGEAQTANFAAAFQALGLAAIAHSHITTNSKQQITFSLSQMTARTALGQHWDVQDLPDEAAYWKIVAAKSVPFFAEAFYIGAIGGGASQSERNQIRRIGQLYGELIQINDDVNDVLSVPASPDWMSGRKPLPILFAQTVDHPERDRFIALRQTISDPQALTEAQAILLRCGAISYAIAHLLERYKQADEILRATPLPGQVELEKLLERIIQPVDELFELL